jgi:diguanylate cyclase (GGDEF)-like protein
VIFLNKIKVGEWNSAPPLYYLKPEDVGQLKINWPVYTDEAYIDQLTNLPNRRAFDKILSAAVKEATAQGAGFSMLLFDLDHFKLVNDTYGHVAGDSILKEFARRISGSLRSTDICSRYGGEEFSILTVASHKKAFEIGERVRLAVKQLLFSIPHHKPIIVTCSFGCAIFPFDASNGQDLLEKTDKALYQAKELGRDRGVQV